MDDQDEMDQRLNPWAEPRHPILEWIGRVAINILAAGVGIIWLIWLVMLFKAL